MPYAKFDDRWHDHKKIRRVLRREPAAVAMHAMAITYCAQHNTDGEIDAEWVAERLELMPYRAPKRLKIVALLLEYELFERKNDDVFVVHDYLDWNLSREQRSALADQGRRGGRAKRNESGPSDKPPLSPGSSDGSSSGSSEGYSEGLSPAGGNGLSTPSPRHATPTEKKVNSNAELRSAVAECFAYWQEKCSHPQAELSTDRRGKIEARLRARRAHHDGDLHAAILDVRQAIDGAARAAHVNEEGKRFDDIELICRNGSKLESFMDRAVAVPLRAVPSPIGRRENASDLLRRLGRDDSTIEGTAS